MSQTLQNQILLAKSMNGIITLSDGAGTTISNGQVQTSDVSSNSVATGSLSMGAVDLQNSMTLEQYDNISTAVGNVSLWEKGKSYFTYLPQSLATPTNASDLVTLQYLNLNYATTTGTTTITGNYTFTNPITTAGISNTGTLTTNNLTYSNISSVLPVYNAFFTIPSYVSGGIYNQYSGNLPTTVIGGWRASSNAGTGIPVTYTLDIVTYTSAYTSVMPPSGYQYCAISNFVPNSTCLLRTDNAYSIYAVAGEYNLSFYAIASDGVLSAYIDDASSGVVYAGIYGLTPTPNSPNWTNYSLAFVLDTPRYLRINFQNYISASVSNNFALFDSVTLTLQNGIVIKDTATNSTSIIGGTYAELNSLYVNDGLNVESGGATIIGGLNTNTAYGISNLAINTIHASSASASSTAYNVALGAGALSYATTAQATIAIGYGAQQGAPNNQGCVAIGHRTGTGTDYNIAIGYLARANGPDSINIGRFSGYLSASLGQNVFIGNYTAYGDNAFGGGYQCNNCVSVGYSAGRNVIDLYNTAIGSRSLEALSGRGGILGGSTTQYNTAVGYLSGGTRSVMHKCTFLGALSNGIEGLVQSTAIGYNCVVDLSNCIQLGSNAERVQVSGGIRALGNYENLFEGATIVRRLLPIPQSSMNLASAGVATTIGIGNNCMPNFGSSMIVEHMIGIGEGTFEVGNGLTSCIAIGTNSQNVMNAGSAQNVSVGKDSLLVCTLGTNNTVVGEGGLKAMTSGNFNTCLGFNAGALRTSYTRCTLLGYNADCSGNLVQACAIGSNSVATQNNQIAIGTASENTLIAGSLTVSGGVVTNGTLTMNGVNVMNGSLTTNGALVISNSGSANQFEVKNQFVHSAYQGGLITGATTIATTNMHEFYSISAGATGFTITLPAITSANLGRMLTFRRVSGTTTATISVTGTGNNLYAFNSITPVATATLMASGVYVGRVVSMLVATTPTYGWFVV